MKDIIRFENFNLETLSLAVVELLIIAIIIDVLEGRRTFHYYQPKPLPRKDFPESTQRDTKIKQGFLCSNCKKPPRHWEFHHKDGNRSNNSFSNCEGMCLDCHAEKHRKPKLF